MLISRRKAIGGLLVTGAALGSGLIGTPSAFASSHLTLAQPSAKKFKATIKTSHVALKRQKAGKKASRAALKTYKLKTNSQAATIAAKDLKATFTAYPVNTTSGPLGTIVTGDSGSDFWFVEGANRIGKITTQGAITEYLLPLSGYEPYGIANGPGDTFWFTYAQHGSNTSYIGRMTGAGGQVTLYSLPGNLEESRITRGPNDTLWFTGSRNQVGSITADGALTIYTLDKAIASYVDSITSGPDGALWFGYGGNNGDLAYGVGRITTDGSVTFYPLANGSIDSITMGRNNDLWFSVFEDPYGNKGDFVGRITVDGTLTSYYMGSQLKGNAYPHAIAHLGNGTFAFGTCQEGGKGGDHQYIGTITPAGDVQVFETPNADQVNAMVYAGWANEVWFTSTDKKNSGKDKIYKFRVTN